jgi:hypothetical protein
MLSCKNMFKTAEKALVLYSKSKKVIIMEHPPRYDTKDSDPSSLKPEFARYANNVYQQLWFASSLKNKIVKGQHNLQCSENVRLERFVNKKNKKYDGVHMYSQAGRKAYTESVKTILCANIKSAEPRLRPSPTNDHKNCHQTKYRKTRKSQLSTKYSVPVQSWETK